MIKKLKHIDLTLEPFEGEILMKDDHWEDSMVYFQMRLPLEKVTPEYERTLRAKVDSEIQLLEIHIAESDDLEEIVKIYNRAWLTSNTPFRLIDLDTLTQLFSKPQFTFLLTKKYGMPCGFVMLDFEGDSNEYGIIVAMGITPRFQRKGLGTALGIAAWELFKEQDVQEIRCEVYVNNKKSYKFISSLGFEEYDVKVYHD